MTKISTHSLRAGISWCICHGRPVFLDLIGDRYFCLPAASARSFVQWRAGEPTASAELERLVAAGVLAPGGPGPVAATTAVPATRDLAHARPRRPRIGDLATAVMLQLNARRALSRSPLAEIVAGLQARRADPETPADEETELRRVAGAFATIAAWLRAQDQCLPRAIAAHRMCARLGRSAALIFGVRVDPFAAHSWVQHGDAVIVGDLETVRLYTPILVIT